jgi:hypothetical protein
MIESTKENARHANAAGIEGDLPGGRISDKDTPSEQPEHGNDRRRFLVWALMLGAVPPERVVERVIAEVESEARA